MALHSSAPPRSGQICQAGMTDNCGGPGAGMNGSLFESIKNVRSPDEGVTYTSAEPSARCVHITVSVCSLCCHFSSHCAPRSNLMISKIFLRESADTLRCVHDGP